jgi:hypothetical protein
MIRQASSVLAEIIRVAPSLHKAGTFSGQVLETIHRYASKQPIFHSVETGSGASTLLFSHLSDDHTVFALDDGTDSIRAVRTSLLFRPESVTFVEGPTQLTIPRYRFEHKLQLVLIDGPHGYPFPDLEYYHLYQHLDRGALFILDDIHIRTINNLFDFLCADDMFGLEQVIDNTAIFRRSDAPTFSPVGDGWWTQGYNRADFEATPVQKGVSNGLARVGRQTPFYIDELGPVANPLQQSSVNVRTSEPLLVTGWAIDREAGAPAAWIELVLDGRPYRTETRVPRGDIATAHGGSQYRRSGFRALLPAEEIRPGRHTLALRIVLRGGQTYFQAPDITFTAE